MFRLTALLFFLAVAVPVRAEGLAATDQADIVAVIRDQIAAFQANDAARAFGYASPGIQAKFGTPEAFLEMVRIGYFPVYRGEGLAFRGITIEDGVPVQAVEVRGASGLGVLALYFMERQPDGSWRISGVILTRLPERTA